MISLRHLRERKLAQWAVAYLAGAWLVLQVLDLVAAPFHLPDAVQRGAIVVLAVGFLGALVLAWYHGEKGKQKVSSVEIGLLTGVLVLAGVGVAFVAPSPASAPAARADAPVVAQRSIAVLPFENMSSDKEQDYFADGISEDLLNLLSSLPALRVAARSSAFSFKGKDVPVDSIARALRVANVLEGSVQKAGGQVRISVQLVRASDGYQIWAKSWDRKPVDVFAIQDEIARDVASQLQIRLLGTAPAAQQTDPKAYALFLQARELGRHATPEAYARSDSLYRRALAIDPRYARAWVQLAVNLSGEAAYGLLPGAEASQQARAAVERALAIDSTEAHAYSMLGWLDMQDGDLAAAARDHERALALAPTDLAVLENASNLLGRLGRVPELVAVRKYVVAHDPVNVKAITDLAYAYQEAGRLDDAAAQDRTALSLSPGKGVTHFLLATVLLRKGDAAGALREIEQEPLESWRMLGLPMVYHALGRRQDSDAALAQLIREHGKGGAYNIAQVFAYQGEADRAFAWLEKAVEHKEGVQQIAADPLLQPLHSDPRWLPFLRRIGKAPEQLARIPFHVRVPPASAAPPAAGRGAT